MESLRVKMVSMGPKMLQVYWLCTCMEIFILNVLVALIVPVLQPLGEVKHISFLTHCGFEGKAGMKACIENAWLLESSLSIVMAVKESFLDLILSQWKGHQVE